MPTIKFVIDGTEYTADVEEPTTFVGSDSGSYWLKKPLHIGSNDPRGNGRWIRSVLKTDAKVISGGKRRRTFRKKSRKQRKSRKMRFFY
jgi:hypothetical protein